MSSLPPKIHNQFACERRFSPHKHASLGCRASGRRATLPPNRKLTFCWPALPASEWERKSSNTSLEARNGRVAHSSKRSFQHKTAAMGGGGLPAPNWSTKDPLSKRSMSPPVDWLAGRGRARAMRTASISGHFTDSAHAKSRRASQAFQRACAKRANHHQVSFFSQKAQAEDEEK